MIIRITVNDRKYIHRLKDFAKAMPLCDEYYGDNISKMRDEYITSGKNNYEYLCQKVANGTANDEQIILLKKIIVSKFKYYCTFYPYVVMNENERNILMNQFKVNILSALTPKPENGEYVYIFLNASLEHNNIIVL